MHSHGQIPEKEGGKKNSTDRITDVEKSTAVTTSSVHIRTDVGPKYCATAGLSVGLQRLLE